MALASASTISATALARSRWVFSATSGRSVVGSLSTAVMGGPFSSGRRTRCVTYDAHHNVSQGCSGRSGQLRGRPRDQLRVLGHPARTRAHRQPDPVALPVGHGVGGSLEAPGHTRPLHGRVPPPPHNPTPPHPPP